MNHLHILFCLLSRFVYGQVKDFITIAFGAKLYKFAHEMQIDTLKDELLEFFKQTNKSSEIFTLFDLYHSTGNQAGLDNCKLVSKKVYVFIVNINIESIFFTIFIDLFAIRFWRWKQKKPLLPRTG